MKTLISWEKSSVNFSPQMNGEISLAFSNIYIYIYIFIYLNTGAVCQQLAAIQTFFPSVLEISTVNLVFRTLQTGTARAQPPAVPGIH